MWDYGGLHEKSLAVLELDIKTMTKEGASLLEVGAATGREVLAR